MIARPICACALFGLAALGCKNETAQALPLPAGSGVAPPAIPKVEDLITESSSPDRGAKGSGLTATGTLFPNEQAELGPKTSGVLSAVLVEEGQTVKKGQLLFRLEASQANLAVQQAKTMLETAKVNLRAAELEYQRIKELHGRGSVPQATYDQVQARYDSAKTSVAQAEVALSMAQRTSADTVVRSPIDGVVTAKLKSVGETVTMMPPTVVLIVQDLRKLELRARLPERSLATLNPGTPLTVKVPALDIERTVPVERVNPAVDPLTRTVEVIAKLDNADGKLKPGMLVEVSQLPPSAPAVASAPSQAPSAAPAPGPGTVPAVDKRQGGDSP